MSLFLLHCACAVRRLVTDSATRNRLREKNAREQWRESQIVNQDLDRREQSNRWTCGYTGHVPRLRDTFAVRNVVAAKTIRPKEEDPWSFDGGAELLSRPSTSPQRLPTASSRPGTSSGFARVEAVCGGQRRLVASPSLNYPGNGFCGTVLPKKRTDRMTRCVKECVRVRASVTFILTYSSYSQAMPFLRCFRSGRMRAQAGLADL